MPTVTLKIVRLTKTLLRIIALKEPKKPFDFDAFNSEFITSLKYTLFGEAYGRNNDRPLERRPRLIILQVSVTPDFLYESILSPFCYMKFFMYQAMKSIRELPELKQVPIFAWQPVSAAGAIVRFGPEEYGGNGDLSMKVHSIKAQDEKERNKEAEKVSTLFSSSTCEQSSNEEKIYNRINKDVIAIPGLPEMYDYEYSPQQV